jgi:hypothetical protein
LAAKLPRAASQCFGGSAPLLFLLAVGQHRLGKRSFFIAYQTKYRSNALFFKHKKSFIQKNKGGDKMIAFLF